MSEKEPINWLAITVDDLLEMWLDRLYALAEQAHVRFAPTFDQDGRLIEVSLVPIEE